MDLEILIKTVADDAGVTQTQQQVANLKKELGSTGTEGQQTGQKLTGAAGNVAREMRTVQMAVHAVGMAMDGGLSPTAALALTRHLLAAKVAAAGLSAAMAASTMGIGLAAAAAVSVAVGKYNEMKDSLQEETKALKQAAADLAAVQQSRMWEQRAGELPSEQERRKRIGTAQAAVSTTESALGVAEEKQVDFNEIRRLKEQLAAQRATLAALQQSASTDQSAAAAEQYRGRLGELDYDKTRVGASAEQAKAQREATLEAARHTGDAEKIARAEAAKTIADAQAEVEVKKELLVIETQRLMILQAYQSKLAEIGAGADAKAIGEQVTAQQRIVETAGAGAQTAAITANTTLFSATREANAKIAADKQRAADEAAQAAREKEIARREGLIRLAERGGADPEDLKRMRGDLSDYRQGITVPPPAAPATAVTVPSFAQRGVQPEEVTAAVKELGAAYSGNFAELLKVVEDLRRQAATQSAKLANQGAYTP
jgi:hypothetical protein